MGLLSVIPIGVFCKAIMSPMLVQRIIDIVTNYCIVCYALPLILKGKGRG